MYSKLSSIYDELMQEDVDYTKWADYINELLARSNVEGNIVLDLGCGTGNITIPLSEMGYEMEGLDISEEMLSIADHKAFDRKRRIKWIHGNMVDYTMENTYDAIISCCDSVNYILEDKDLLKMFHNVYHSLKDKGIFAFDIHSFYKLKEVYNSQVFSYSSDKINYMWENTYDDTSDVIEYYINMFIKNDKNPYYTRSEEFHYQRAYHMDVIEQMLINAGFRSVDLYAFGTFERPQDNTERLQFCAIK